MSPPIYTPDGSEVSEIVLPDGSTASQVIGPDGNVVFEAGPDIPDSALIDSFEDSNFDDDYGGDGSKFTQTSAYSTDGTYSCNGDLDSGYPYSLISTNRGLAYPERGNQITYDVRFEGSAMGLRFAFAVQEEVLPSDSNANWYEIEVHNNNDVNIDKRTNGSTTRLASGNYNFNPDQWYSITIDWGVDSDDQIAVSVEGSEEASATDLTWDSGGIGYTIFTDNDADLSNVYIDYVQRIKP